MKKSTTLVKTLFGAAALTLCLGVTSCKNEAKPEDTKEVAEDQNEVKFDENESKEDDSEFLVDAAETSMAEVETGKLALTKSTDTKVKEFANMMIKDHTKAGAETKAFADRLNVSLPAALTDEGKEHYNKLNEKSGVDFEKEYADMMVKGHEDAISKMEKASTDGNDPEVKAWATNMIPTLKAHLEHAKSLQELVKNKK